MCQKNQWNDQKSYWNYNICFWLGDGGEDEKRDMLTEFIEEMGKDDKAIVFVGKKSKVDDIASDLSLKSISVQSIHGDRDQSDREQALMDLKSGEVHILIATDVASRGIDIQVIISLECWKYKLFYKSRMFTKH